MFDFVYKSVRIYHYDIDIDISVRYEALNVFQMFTFSKTTYARVTCQFHPSITIVYTWLYRQTDRQSDRQAGRQADRQTDKQSDRQTYTRDG